MAEDNNPVNKGAEDSNGGEPAGQPAIKPDTGSSKPAVDPAEQARREQQSKKDQAIVEKDSLADEVAFLSAKEAERARDSYVSELLTNGAEKYPNVKADNPLFKYAASKEEVEEIAVQIQNQFKDLQQEALSSVQTEGVQTLTDKEIAEQEVELEKTANNEGRSTFGSYLTNLSRRKR